MQCANGLQQNPNLGDDLELMGINPDNIASEISNKLQQETADAKAKILDTVQKAQEKINSAAEKVQSTATPQQQNYANSVYNRPAPKLIGIAAGAIAGITTYHLRAKNAKAKYLVPVGVGIAADILAHFTTAQVIQARGM